MLNTILEDRLLRYVVVVGLTLVLITTLLYISPVYKAVGGKQVALVYDLQTIFFAGLATALMVMMMRTFVRKEILWYVWGCLALGMLLWTIGEIFWATYELILDREVPSPSAADIGWVIGYIPLFIGFILRFRSLQTMPTRREWVVSGGLFLLLLIVAVVFVIGPIITYEDYDSRVEQTVNILYPIGDLGIAYVTLLSVIVLAGGMLSYPWLVLTAGFLVTAVADLFYLYADWNELYLTGSDQGTNLATVLADIPYLAGYVIIALAMVMQVRLRRAL